jgi:ankyrin repeat protein
LRGSEVVLDALLGRPSGLTTPPLPQKLERTDQKLETTEREIALQKAIEANDIDQIHSLLNDGLNVDSARTWWGDRLLEYTFFENRVCYDIMLPYSRDSDHLWTVWGIISAATTSENLEVYFDGKIEDREEHNEYDIEPDDVLKRSIELAIAYNRIHEFQTLLSLEWVRERLYLEKLLLEAADSQNLDAMIELATYGTDLTILDEINSQQMDELLTDVLHDRLQTGRLQKLLNIGWRQPEDLFCRILELLAESEIPFDALEKVQFLIDHGLNLNSAISPSGYLRPIGPSDCCTPLQLAVRCASLKVVRYLVDVGADINYNHEYCSHTTLGVAVRAVVPETVRFLVQSGANLNDFGDDQETTLVELAVGYEKYYKDGPEVFKILLEMGADINGPTHRKPGASWNTTLTKAILNSKEHEIIYLALDYRADIHQMGGGNGARTPLQAAAEKGEIKIVKELLKRGAYVNAPAAPDHGRTALQAACEGGKVSEDVISLLLAEGADVSAPSAPGYGRTALQALCSSENPSSELMTLLIDRGADINAPAASRGGLTALQGAALMGNIKIAILLMDRGADVNAPPSSQDGRMALDGAAEYGRLDTVHLLLTSGAKCMVPGASGYDSAVEFAEENGHFAIADILRSYNPQPQGRAF